MTQLWILKIRYEALGDKMEWTAGGGYPHLFGTFGASDIVEVKKFTRVDPQTWAEATSGEWFE
jgi:uncharacterized protein (DUF952 family)